MQTMSIKPVVESVLRNGISEVVFTKTDGTVRVMYATLSPQLIQDITGILPETGQIQKVNNTRTIRVMDIQAEDWRSFNVDSLISINGADVPSIKQFCIPKSDVCYQ